MKKILIIEDSIELRNEVTDWFIFEGFEPYVAGNGKEGVQLAIKNLPELILCDIMMPEMDGKAVFEILRNNPSTRLIPFVFMTALADRKYIRSGMEMGADDYLTKPFTREEMMATVQTRLMKSEQIRGTTAEALDELRNNLISNLPHELNTPLNGILGFGQMMKEYPETFDIREIRETGNQIHTNAKRLFRLIHNYLLFARLELKPTKEPGRSELTNPEEVCEWVGKKVAAGYHRENDLSVNAGRITITITEPEFAKIVEELTDNAFKFSRSGTKVSITGSFVNGGYQFTISDYGCGMSAENIKKIGAYMQFDRKMQEQQGSGLGLIISKRIVELFKGTLEVSSVEGQGTTVTVIVPAKL